MQQQQQPKARLAFPQTNNGVFTIGRNVNIRFEHGIAMAEEQEQDKFYDNDCDATGRIGIVLWGVVAEDAIQADNDPDGGTPPKLLPRKT